MEFSAEMMIQDTLSLWVENGDKTEEGARVSPGSTMELSGEVVFFRNMERPHFDCDVEVRLNGNKVAKYCSWWYLYRINICSNVIRSTCNDLGC